MTAKLSEASGGSILSHEVRALARPILVAASFLHETG